MFKPFLNDQKVAHFAEVRLKTGLGDVIACSPSGVEIRKSADLLPWGLIEHIPGKYEMVLCVIGKKLDTKNILAESLMKAERALLTRYFFE